MQLPETVVLDIPNLLVLAGVVVSLLAAIYSARSARASQRQASAAEAALSESKRQNRIASHGHQLEIFKALLSFSSQISANGIHFPQEPVWELWEHARIAEFYFSEGTTKKLEAIVEAALTIQTQRNSWKLDNTSPASEKPQAVKETYALLALLREDLKIAEQQMRQELRLVADAE